MRHIGKKVRKVERPIPSAIPKPVPVPQQATDITFRFLSKWQRLVPEQLRKEIAAARRENAKHTGSGFTDRVFARLKPVVDSLDSVVAEQYQLAVNEALEH